VITAKRCAPAEIKNIIAGVLKQQANPFGNLSLDELLNGACFTVEDEQGQIGAYVLIGQGSECWVQAAAGSSRMNLCDLFNELIDKHASGFKTVAFKTYRRGLVKNAIAHGYQIAEHADGYTMRKYL